MATQPTDYADRARLLLEHLSEDALRAAVVYLEFLAYLEEDEREPPLTDEERAAVLRFHAGDTSGLVPARDVTLQRAREAAGALNSGCPDLARRHDDYVAEASE